MQMTTSGYISAFQGLRALWGWWRKKDDEPEPTAHERHMEEAHQRREHALVQAQTIQDVAQVHIETQRAISQARSQQRRERLEPVMAMFASVQANKRTSLSEMAEDDAL